MPEMRVLIVGGGIAGLALACLLDQRGFKNVVVVEKVDEYRDVGYVLGIWGNGLRIMKGLGLYEKVVSLGQRIDKFIVTKDDGAEITSMNLDEMTRRFGPSVMTKRADVVKTLYHSAKERGIKILLNTSITNIDQTEKHAQVTFTTGHTAYFDLVVGADGIRSKTRELGGFGDVPLTFWGFKAWGFWVPKTPLMSLNAVTEIWGPEGKMFGLYPAGDEIIAAFCAMPVPNPNAPDPEEHRIERIRKEFDGWGGLVPHILKGCQNAGDMWADDLMELDMDRPMYQGRVVLVGDSAHAILPTAGVGATLALESAAVLAEELCRTGPGYEDIQHALLMWEMRRAPRVKRVRDESNILSQALSYRNPVMVWFRNVVAGALPTTHFSDQMMKLMYDPI